MIELKQDSLVFTFPKVHPYAKLEIDFQRTLQIPDNGDKYPLPPGLGSFPLQHVDDFADSVPKSWNEHGGVMLPMFNIMGFAKYFEVLKLKMPDIIFR